MVLEPDASRDGQLMIGRFRLLGRARTTTKSRTVARTESGILVDIKEREERNRGTDTVHTYNTIPQYLVDTTVTL